MLNFFISHIFGYCLAGKTKIAYICPVNKTNIANGQKYFKISHYR